MTTLDDCERDNWLEAEIDMPPAATPPPGWRRCAMCMRWRPRNELRALRPLTLACKTCRRIAEGLPRAEIEDWLRWPEDVRVYAVRTKHNIDPDRYLDLPPVNQTNALFRKGIGEEGPWPYTTVTQDRGPLQFRVPECYWDRFKRRPWAFTTPGDDEQG